MLSHYQLTPLEQWIEELYRKLEITSPEQLHIIELATKFNIWVYYLDMGSMAIENKGLFSINIDRRLSAKEQWEDFLHELCHMLRHAGNQLSMPGSYMEWQEQDATNFQLYAAIPFSMLKQLHLPERQGELVEMIAEEFHVTHHLAAARLEQIQRRSLQGILDQEYRTQLDEKMRKYDTSNWSQETRAIMDKLNKHMQKKEEKRNGHTRSHL
jgi:hypothetical protein